MSKVPEVFAIFEQKLAHVLSFTLMEKGDGIKKALEELLTYFLGVVERASKAESRIAELEASQRWRVVADGELPELGKEVIFYDSITERRLKGCLRKNGGVEWLSDEGYTFSSRDGRYSRITHYMPLPKLPEVQE